MIGTDAWLVRVFSATGAAIVDANVTDTRLLVRSSTTGPGTVDASQDVSLVWASWVAATQGW